ncbi:MAG: hypothetical protein JSW11_06770 [Candidatus Heimdallarchaeota archaeon]|nr:MAG: hypothetical protein JSW11_06770 [Candidatus Heimdallarchaeota archaeon]
MKIVKSQQKRIFLIFLFVLITVTPMIIERQTSTAQAKIQWDDLSQGTITEQAILSLPSPWKEFFTDSSDFLFIHADGPDQYREHLKYYRMDLYNEEAPRHFDDHDTKELDGTIYNVSLPENAHLIDAQFTAEDIEFISINVSSTSKKYQKGVVEWAVLNFTRKVTDYMSLIANDPSNSTIWHFTIIHMGWLAHYVADATMPLHATVNYDGQLTGQGGIHSFIEYPLLDHETTGYLSDVNFTHKPAVYVDSPINQTLHSIETGLGNVSFILETDKILAPSGVRTKDTIKDMWAILGEMINARLDLAAINTANLWYTALVDSGLMTKLSEEDLASLNIDTTGFDNPWMPPIPPEDESSKTQVKKTPGFGLVLLNLVMLSILCFRKK